MASDCVRHAMMFFNRADFDLTDAKPGTFTLSPHNGMVADLRRDYGAMAGMIFGRKPPVDEVLGAIEVLEQTLNRDNGHRQ